LKKVIKFDKDEEPRNIDSKNDPNFKSVHI